MSRTGIFLSNGKNQYRNLDFYYFSGTGNTYIIVEAMKKVFEENGFEVRLLPMEKGFVSDLNKDSFFIGLAFPVAMQGTYPFVWNFVKDLPDKLDNTNKRIPIFMVDTMGMFSGGVVGPMKKIIDDKKIYNPIGAKEIKMPSNIRGKTSEEENKDIKEKGIKEAKIYVKKIINGESVWGRIPVLSDLMSLMSRWEGHWKSIQRWMPIFVDKEKCIGCGICAKLCPVENIEIKNKLAVRGNECYYCMRCVEYCPTDAMLIKHFGRKKYSAVKADKLLVR